MLHALTETPFASGDLTFRGKLYSAEKRASLLAGLIKSISWNEDYCVVFGRRFDIPRLQAWYADDGIQYSYSNNLLKTQAWCDALLAVKHDVERRLAYSFNSVLVTYYRNGDDHVTWHADDEKELGPKPLIASFSLGVSRNFCFRHKYNDLNGCIPVHDGDLLLMRPGFQNHWEHCVPSEPSLKTPRINLTFRRVLAP